METFTEKKPLIPNPDFDSDRRKALKALRAELTQGSIEEPTIDIVERFSSLPFCYTLQSCYGHFVSGSCKDDRNMKRVVDLGSPGTILHYRIAYMAFCVQNSGEGRAMLEELKAIADIDPYYIQFGSANWFWERCVNSYVLQVSPLRNAYEDHFKVTMEDALRIEETRDRFFEGLREVLSRNPNQEG